MKGIILAGGTGSRLYPLTLYGPKSLQRVYNKPIILYGLCTLMLAGINKILIITTPEDSPDFQRRIGNGGRWNISISYTAQAKPEGLAQAFIVAEDAGFSRHEPCAMILGDNIFHGDGLAAMLQEAAEITVGGTVFGYKVTDPRQYGVVEFDQSGRVLSIEEKPSHPKSPFALPGLYFFDRRVVEFARQQQPSARGELEITDLMQTYLEQGQLTVKILGRGHAWFDTGTIDDLEEADDYVKAIEHRQGWMLGNPDEVAWRMGFLNDERLFRLADPIRHTAYGQHLLGLLNEKKVPA